MARGRQLKPSFFTDGDLLDLEPLARLLFAGLWCIADREGRLKDKPKDIKIQILPCDDVDVDGMLDSLSPAFITRYEVDGNGYIQINNFKKHQTPHKNEIESVIPPPPCADTTRAPEDFGANTEAAQCEDDANTIQAQEHSPLYPCILEPCILDGYGVSTPPPDPEERPPKKFIKPSLDDIAAYCNERGNVVDPQRFVDHYTANGWKVGKNPMKDWKAAVRTWERNEYQAPPAGKPPDRPKPRPVTDKELFDYYGIEVNKP